jgi:AcrR family transcriptional regulator
MPRTVKPPDIRRQELLDAASKLFASHGFRDTTVDAIIREAGTAKGTFYYYFASKNEILEALVRQIVVQLASEAHALVEDKTLPALEKLRRVRLGQRQQLMGDASAVMDDLHRPENRDLHERMNVEIIHTFAPILAEIVEQGKREGVLHVDAPLEVVQFLLAGAQFLFDQALFTWTLQERQARLQAMQLTMELALGAVPGALAFLLDED